MLASTSQLERGRGDQSCAGHAKRVAERNGATVRIDEPGIFRPIVSNLLEGGAYYMLLADLRSYLDAQSRPVIYSIGPNLKDENGLPRAPIAEGDLVWRYALPEGMVFEDFILY